jgi:CspA family cold shock protein
MATGAVKVLNPAKGFRFIAPRGGSSDVLVYISAVERAGLRDLRGGQPVVYDIEADRRTGKASATHMRLD